MRKATAILALLLLIFPAQSLAQKGRKPQTATSSSMSEIARKELYEDIDEGWRAFTYSSPYFYNYNEKRMTVSPPRIKFWFKLRLSLNTHDRDKALGKVIANRREDKLPVKGYDRFSYSMLQVEFDCDARTMRQLRVLDYDQEGDILDSFESPPYKAFREVVPGSKGEALLERACEVMSESK
jgi:hypothetical protein